MASELLKIYGREESLRNTKSERRLNTIYNRNAELFNSKRNLPSMQVWGKPQKGGPKQHVGYSNMKDQPNMRTMLAGKDHIIPTKFSIQKVASNPVLVKRNVGPAFKTGENYETHNLTHNMTHNSQRTGGIYSYNKEKSKQQHHQTHSNATINNVETQRIAHEALLERELAIFRKEVEDKYTQSLVNIGYKFPRVLSDSMNDDSGDTQDLSYFGDSEHDDDFSNTCIEYIYCVLYYIYIILYIVAVVPAFTQPIPELYYKDNNKKNSPSSTKRGSPSPMGHQPRPFRSPDEWREPIAANSITKLKTPIIDQFVKPQSAYKTTNIDHNTQSYQRLHKVNKGM